jgi:hypothetical protein
MTLAARFVAITGLLLCAACASTRMIDAGSVPANATDGSDGLGDGSARDAAAGDGDREADAAADAGGARIDGGVLDSGATELDCSDIPLRFPAFDRSCKTAADCAIGTRPLDCCGTVRVTGIRALDSDVFAAATEICNDELKPCTCDAGPTLADDGTTDDARTTLDSSASVDCVAGLCQTTIGPCGSRCDPETEICVTQETMGAHSECKPLPPACSADRTCECVADSVCIPGLACNEQGKNHVVCVCLSC